MNSKFKAFSDVLAIFLAMLIVVYLITGYIKTNSGSTNKPNVEKPSFLENITYLPYFHMALLLLFSAAVGLILKRLPWLSVIAASLPVIYSLSLFADGFLKKYPTGVMLLSAAHLAGAIIYAASCDVDGKGEKGGISCAFGGTVIGMGGAVFSACLYLLESRVAAVAETVALLKEQGITFVYSIRTIPGAVDRIYSTYLCEGSFETRCLINDFERSLNNLGIGTGAGTGTKINLLNDITGELAGVYASLAVALLGASVLAFVLSKRHKSMAFFVSAIPVLIISYMLIIEKIKAGGIILLSLSVILTACYAARFATGANMTDTAEADDGNTDGEGEASAVESGNG